MSDLSLSEQNRSLTLIVVRPTFSTVTQSEFQIYMYDETIRVHVVI